MKQNYKYPRFINIFLGLAIGAFVVYFMSEHTEVGLLWLVFVAATFSSVSVVVLNHVYDSH